MEKMIVLPLRAEVEEVVLISATLMRVEARERLVEDQDLRVVDDRRDELDLLLHALGELVDLLVEPGAQLHLVEPVRDPLLRASRGRPP